jgi:protein-S-isoprenylcysteine O-methyltransferase Ste14
MSTFITRFRASRFIWTVLVAFYFVVFFRNLLADALPQDTAVPLAFAVAFVLWLAVEYYFGSPFFQSGVVEHSALWRGVFAFFVYPFIGYVAADFIWWHWTQVPAPAALAGIVGLAVFGLGTYVRLATLAGLLRIMQVKPAPAGKKGAVDQITIPERKFVGLRLQRLVRHPRYLGTFAQLLGAAIVFRSWGGLVLALVLGLPLLLLQARHEDARLGGLLKAEFAAYAARVPEFWPRFRAQSGP